jgi:hypothetical protein
VPSEIRASSSVVAGSETANVADVDPAAPAPPIHTPRSGSMAVIRSVTAVGWLVA